MLIILKVLGGNELKKRHAYGVKDPFRLVQKLFKQ